MINATQQNKYVHGNDIDSLEIAEKLRCMICVIKRSVHNTISNE